jgi:integrase
VDGGDEGSLKSGALERDVPIPLPLPQIAQGKNTGTRYVLRQEKADQYFLEWMKCMISCGFAHPVDRKKGKAADLRFDYERETTAYYMRHDSITRLKEGGIDPIIIMRLAGHMDSRTSANVYICINFGLAKETMNKLYNAPDKK